MAIDKATVLKSHALLETRFGVKIEIEFFPEQFDAFVRVGDAFFTTYAGANCYLHGIMIGLQIVGE